MDTEHIQADGEFLLKKESEILRKLAEAGLVSEDTEPYTFLVPTTLYFDVGRGRENELRSVYAVVAMAKASYADAEIVELTEDDDPKFQKVRIYDPYAMNIEKAIADWQKYAVVKGLGRIVNGRFYRVA